MSNSFAICSMVSSAAGSGAMKISGKPAFFAYSKSLRIWAGSFGSVMVPPPMIVMPAASIFARRARVVSGWIGARQVDVLERHVRDAERLGHVERLIERELPARIGRDAELRAVKAFRGGAVPLGSASARRLKVPTESAAPTNARRETMPVIIDPPKRRQLAHGRLALGNATLLHACCESSSCLICAVLAHLPVSSVAPPSRTGAPAISWSRYPATKNFISRAVRWSQKPDRA